MKKMIKLSDNVQVEEGVTVDDLNKAKESIIFEAQENIDVINKYMRTLPKGNIYNRFKNWLRLSAEKDGRSFVNFYLFFLFYWFYWFYSSSLLSYLFLLLCFIYLNYCLKVNSVEYENEKFNSFTLFSFISLLIILIYSSNV